MQSAPAGAERPIHSADETTPPTTASQDGARGLGANDSADGSEALFNHDRRSGGTLSEHSRVGDELQWSSRRSRKLTQVIAGSSAALTRGRAAGNSTTITKRRPESRNQTGRMTEASWMKGPELRHEKNVEQRLGNQRRYLSCHKACRALTLASKPIRTETDVEAHRETHLLHESKPGPRQSVVSALE